MKNQFKYSILITLTLLMSIGLVFAQPAPLGTTKQAYPYESNPGAASRISTALYWSGPTAMYDGDLMLAGYIRPAASTAPDAIWFQLSSFTVPNWPEPFTPDWVDLKMKYDITGGVDDMYRIEYQVAGSGWVTLQADTTEGFPGQIRPWAQIAEPNDGVWDWTEINSINLRVTYTKVGSYSTVQMTMYIYEVWLSVYPSPPPPTSSTTLSVQPPAVLGVTSNPGMTWADNIMFVDIYVQEVLDLWSYEFYLDYDTTPLTALDAFTYYPWTENGKLTIDDAAGSVYMSYTMGVGLGQDGSSPVARIYFVVEAAGSSALTIRKGESECILGDHLGAPMARIIYDGFFGGSYYLSYTGGIFPAYTDPTGSVWHEDYPTYSTTWTVTGWTDNGDGSLNPSDQLLIDVGGDVKEYHVDQVTITIHWTFKDTYVGEAGADPEDPTSIPDPPEFDPLWTRWHQIYPDYCRTFTIESWEDNGDGVFSPTDQFDFTYDDTFENVNAHLDAITTNLWLSEKPPGEPPVPEFPLGVSMLIAFAPMIAIIYVWRLRKKDR